MLLLIAVAALLLLSQSGQVSSLENDHPATGGVHHHPHGVTLTLRQNSNLDTMQRGAQNINKEYPCPIDHEIAPCICSVDYKSRLNLDCSAVSSDEQLAAVLTADFPVKYFYSFRIDQNDNIAHLGHILNGVTFQLVSLRSVKNLEFIADEFLLDSSNTLESLMIVQSALTPVSFPFLTLQLYSQLQSLTIDNSPQLTSIPKLTSNSLKYSSFFGSSITSIDPGTFDAVPQLQTLDLQYNAISSLLPGTFTLTNSFDYLRLISNQITNIEPGAFVVPENSEPTTELLTIDLASNLLTHLEAGSFIMTDRPHVLRLSINNLTSLEAGAFVLPQTTEHFSLALFLQVNALTVLEEQVLGELFPYITKLDVYGNPLVCGCDITWLVLNQEYMAKIDGSATCADGRALQDLDPADYEASC